MPCEVMSRPQDTITISPPNHDDHNSQPTITLVPYNSRATHLQLRRIEPSVDVGSPPG